MIQRMSTSNTHWVNLSRERAMARFADAPFASPSRTSSGRPASGSATEDSHALAGLLLAAAMAALLVVADQVIDTWTDGHLLAGWVALWTVAFAGLALLAPPLRQMAAFMAGGFVSYFAEWKAMRDEARMWEMASHDPRVMEEIRAAMVRHDEAA